MLEHIVSLELAKSKGFAKEFKGGLLETSTVEATKGVNKHAPQGLYIDPWLGWA